MAGQRGGGMRVEEAWRENPKEEKAERQGKKENTEEWTTLTRRPELRRAIQLPGFSSARSWGFWGLLPPGPHLSLAWLASGSLSRLRLCAPLSQPLDSEKSTLVLGRGGGRKQKRR